MQVWEYHHHFYKMHQHVKLILKPLLDLRRAGYRLFSVEKAEENYFDLTFFNDTESLRTFMESTKDYFFWEKFIRSKDKDEEKLNNFVKRETNQEELKNELPILEQFGNIIIKFGRFIPNSLHKFDDILGVELASNNQYAKFI